jgi:hypothetical protein
MDLNFRNVPKNDVRDLKAAALRAGMTLKAYCLKVLTEYEYVAEEPPTDVAERPTG